jgi:hypothetical protein
MGGFVDKIFVSSKDVLISGWGMLQSAYDAEVVVDTNLPIKISSLTTIPRPDVVSVLHDRHLLNSGITVKLDLDERLAFPDKMMLCVWTKDPEFGNRLLDIPSRPWICPLLAKSQSTRL